MARNFKAVMGMGTTVLFVHDNTKITPELEGKGKIVKVGESIEGTYQRVGQYTDEETGKPKAFFCLVTDAGENLTLFEKGNLKAQMMLVPEGKYVRVTYQGMQPMKVAKFGQDHFNSFLVEIGE